MPKAPIVKIKYFSGTSDDPEAIYKEIDAWLAKTQPVGYQPHSTIHFHPEDRKWYIMVTLIWQSRISPIQVPTLVPRRVD